MTDESSDDDLILKTMLIVMHVTFNVGMIKSNKQSGEGIKIISFLTRGNFLAIIEQRGDPLDYVDMCYSVDLYKEVYKHAIMGINGEQLWSQTLFVPHLPPSFGRGIGRPCMARRREPSEVLIKHKNKQGNTVVRLKRQQRTICCRLKRKRENAANSKPGRNSAKTPRGGGNAKKDVFVRGSKTKLKKIESLLWANGELTVCKCGETAPSCRWPWMRKSGGRRVIEVSLLVTESSPGMSPIFNMVKYVNPSKSLWALKLRLIRAYDVFFIRRRDEIFSFDCVFKDRNDTDPQYVPTEIKDSVDKKVVASIPLNLDKVVANIPLRLDRVIADIPLNLDKVVANIPLRLDRSYALSILAHCP
ncbi:hypothetical protein DH2020_025764 [Rehmannia glutinosa]|uniref:Uncharacterized protein n=1 Tax=Rehmannia glutinosa TaxID=99300 RepID=A0ABR0VYS4_REHGL